MVRLQVWMSLDGTRKHIERLSDVPSDHWTAPLPLLDNVSRTAAALHGEHSLWSDTKAKNSLPLTSNQVSYSMQGMTGCARAPWGAGVGVGLPPHPLPPSQLYEGTSHALMAATKSGRVTTILAFASVQQVSCLLTVV